MALLTTLGWILAGIVAFVVVLRIVSLVHPHPFPSWMQWLLEIDGKRREHVLERVGFAPGMRVLELGPGGGFMTERVVPQLGSEGRLVCLDLQPAMLEKVRARLGAAAPALVCASGSALPFRTGAFDLVFLVSVLGEIPDHEGAVRECARILRPGGRLAVTEDVGDPDYVRSPVLRRWAARAGLEPGERLGSIFRYTHRFAKPAGA